MAVIRPIASKPPCILVVEDESVVAYDLERHLKTMGYECCGLAASGEEALEMAERLRPDLVLMDIDLPLLNGVEATREIRRTLAPGPWVLVLSSYSKRELEEVTEEELFDGYINKPLSKSNLLALLRPLLLPR